ncbi:hypothetical protein BDA96_10G057400 [Sorghum bicolor]|uniref:Uncharacterized protein n=1 Tax=Sorghum bicolor TaxID=4558 RepID=A0A921Q343_SORBI|nr:hypothetical protein BDA96_10G057400 [Sorghum bicolor]
MGTRFIFVFPVASEHWASLSGFVIHSTVSEQCQERLWYRWLCRLVGTVRIRLCHPIVESTRGHPRSAIRLARAELSLVAPWHLGLRVSGSLFFYLLLNVEYDLPRSPV